LHSLTFLRRRLGTVRVRVSGSWRLPGAGEQRRRGSARLPIITGSPSYWTTCGATEKNSA